MTIAAAILGWIFVAAGFTCVTLFKLSWVRRRAPEHHPWVLLLRPVDAASVQELRNLSAALPRNVEQLILSPEKPSSPFSGRWIKSDPECSNRKVGHLLRGLE